MIRSCFGWLVQPKNVQGQAVEISSLFLSVLVQFFKKIKGNRNQLEYTLRKGNLLERYSNTVDISGSNQGPPKKVVSRESPRHQGQEFVDLPSRSPSIV